ncbi:MAG: NAD(P)H-quinone oxidoreductase subunit 5 [Pseudanabaena sp.]|jgi:NAD(P)H-quinone oxidoreductase subunit 5|uniref:NAD(P)H-quinone oxidoreductase subunit 5 n=1 Tax=Pseudanabaena mucicola TaxID=71190 RepID=UPI002578D6D0|nr:NAD(P)H-quinone oxidoreductase subunit 5 [Pseudanabaena mucicola]MCA6586611.1 NAD(P)H-quinone oxidoreductase subunit 5 [Pseudanabaena sp. M051S1SP1A06QC]MCA6588530.1 NAD(P)H-quinone oxidoreductase subunit 5 [Pseudanabaena sp. M109S1SP1A06QC]MCA6597568.1 NAD(P)H-quinone oxidoreductase subunit 5 [Pseudanabaena sp. M046S1SP1A06QC]MCA6605931.1 NAD(P)H-quinone oxidoreductase subunit 5 [Pseudanabaena sp. M007S1SP1A06QC]MCA6612752.1 NAD(P)H-quinone oxidoreductase subunit 5 [Pseudanabaena sp. M158S
MDFAYQYAWLIPLLPLAAALIIGTGLITFNESTNKLRSLWSVLSVSATGGAAVIAFNLLWSQIQGHTPYTYTFEWAQAGLFHLNMGFVIDHLTSLMLVIVTTVAFLVQIYTDGYMAHDPSYVRFYAYLSLFTSSMLGLVVSPNLVQIYIFWELVGMCSYLLIGFWFDRKGAADACQKAFVTNRVGDFGLLLGLLGLYWATGTFEFTEMGEKLTQLVESGGLSVGLAILFAILVFMGPAAKSAQFPLHVWLPDAMEGPTPISALIHAATMVAAGVFLIARMFPVFEEIPEVMNTIAWTGAFTAFLGASIAITQNDIKKGLAYSTVSQLGYMVMGMGVGAYGAGLFHLMTHAYFKAMMFLGSGSVIHGMEEVVGHDPDVAQDMRVMGGLRKYMPITAITFFIGTLAISGIPPFAGFWSKDEILASTFKANPILWGIGFLTAGITAFYMFRMYFTTFEGDFRGTDKKLVSNVKAENSVGKEAQVDDGHGHHHASKPHESPITMTFPLIVLAIPSILIGLVGTPLGNYFEYFIHAPSEKLTEVPVEGFTPEFFLMGGSSVGIGLIGISFAILMYLQKKIDPSAIAKSIEPLYKLSKNKWYIDEIYEAIFVIGSRRLARQVLEVDAKIVDGLVNLAGFVTVVTGEGLKYFENGKAQFYALVIFIGVLGFVIVTSI